MSILRSFNIGVSGMRSTGGALSVVGDNIANANTNGFKSSRAQFQDVLATTLKGIEGGDQIGAGTKLAHITPMFTQGNVVRTESITDVAINGDGFFQVDAPFGKGFTRDGTFHFDKEGYLINSDGYRVQGFVGKNNQISNEMGAVRLANTAIPAKATGKIGVSMNLDSREAIKEFNIEDPEGTSSFNTSLTIYDNVGTPRLVTMYFNKSDENAWQYHAVVDGDDAQGGQPGVPVEMASGTLQFSDKGLLQQETENSNSFNFNKGAAADQKISFDFGESIQEGGTGNDATTMYGSKSTVQRHTQDGASAATLGSLSFDDKGVLTAVYNNGEARKVAQLAVVKFDNNEGLFKVGKNLFKESSKSGQGAAGKPNEGGRGEVLSKSIELSNVDLANEFVNLMTTQRNFQANTKTISVADQLLQDVLNLKR